MIRHFISTVVLLVLSFHICAGHHYYHRRYRKGGEAVHRNNELTAVGNIGFLASYPAVGCGLEYERYFGHEGRLSAALQVAAFYGGTFDFGGIHQYEIHSQTDGRFVAPGMRYHFRGHRNSRMIDIGIGASIVLGSSSRHDIYYADLFHPDQASSQGFFGALVTQVDFNFHFPQSPVFFGLFVNTGYVFSNAPVTNVYGASDDPAYIHFGLRLGGKW